MPTTSLQEFFVQLHLTERCNLHCTHCYQSGHKTAELCREEITAVITEISDMLRAWSSSYQLEFAPSLNITGGEPLLRPDLFEILEDLQQREFAVYLLTNGTLINEAKARKLAALGVKGVQVSIEGPAEIHDSIRGRGSFSASTRGISHLVSAGLEVTLAATLSKINAGKFQELIAISSALGVQKLGFSRLVPSGRGAELAAQLLEPEQARELYQSIFNLDAGKLKIVTGDPVASQMQARSGSEDNGPISIGGCAAGTSGLTILPDGTVVPCRRLPIPLGNIRRDSLREIWAESKVLNQLRNRSGYGGRCGTCLRWAQCRGCRAIAYAYAKARGEENFLAEDPQCFIRISD